MSAPRTEGEPREQCRFRHPSSRCLRNYGHNGPCDYSWEFDPTTFPDAAAPEPQTVQGAASEKCGNGAPHSYNLMGRCHCGKFDPSALPPPQPEGATVEPRHREMAREMRDAVLNYSLRFDVDSAAKWLASHEAQIQAEAYEAAAKLVCSACREGMPGEKGDHDGAFLCMAWPIPAVAAALRGK